MDPVIQMVIRLFPNGTVDMQGIPDNKMVAYGMLQVGIEITKGYFDQQQNKLVHPAATMPQLVKPS